MLTLKHDNVKQENQIMIFKPKTLRKASVLAALAIAIQYKKLGMAVTPKVRAVIDKYKLGGKSK